MEIREIQLRNLETLKVIDKFCSNHNIKYSLGYGKLLGAIRHKGYIPWDDDVDLFMLPEDYVEFSKKFRADGYKFEDVNNSCSPIMFGKLIDLNTEAIDPGYSNLNYTQGMFVDIFPLYNYPSNKLFRKVFDLNFLLMALLNNVVNFSADKYTQTLSAKKAAKITRFISIGKINRMIGFLNLLLLSYPTSGLLKEPNEPRTILFNKESFKSKIYVDFEGEKLPVPYGYKDLLNICYDDFMKLPLKVSDIIIKIIYIESYN